MNSLILEIHRKKEIQLLNQCKNNAGPFYVIPSKWYLSWLKYTKGGSKPGRIILNTLLDSKGKPKTNLKYKTDYFSIPKTLWDHLKQAYGSDLQLECSKKDIYSCKLNSLYSHISSRATSPSITHYTSVVSFCSSKLFSSKSSAQLRTSSDYSKNLKVSENGKTPVFQSIIVPVSSKPTLLGVFGLENKGNNCYMNTTLQCLLSINNFTKAILKTKKNSPFLTIFKGFYSQIKTGKADCSKMIDFFKAEFPLGKQHDAPEFLRKIIEYIDKELSPSKIFEECDPWREYENNHSKLIVKLFSGMTCSKLICRNCGKKKEKYEGFTFLTFEVTGQLMKSLERYTEKEVIEGQYFCDGCQGVSDIEKQYFLVRCPNVLVVQLKRFVTVPFSRKINMHCEFGFEIEVCDCNRNKFRYRLKAVVVHTGNWNSGHYTCFCVRNNKWYFFDDLSYEEVDSDKVKEAQAYVLIYTKIVKNV